MKASHLFFALTSVALVTTLTSATVHAKQAKDKMAVCHIGTDTGPNGETYLDTKGCHPNEENDYFCPDAGKVDLIFVGNARGHLGSEWKPSKHSFDGVSDYPAVAVDIAFADVDVDGDGVDEGCEVEPVCADGIYPDPNNCNQFFQCANGQQFPPQNCPAGLAFNPEVNVCDWPQNVHCGGL